MRKRIYLPAQVKESIRGHLAKACQDALETFDSASEDEDTMTGHLGSKLEAGNQRVLVENAQIGGEWKWSLRYYKFRGRGPHPTENCLGADGIFFLQLHIGSRVDAKSLLFQAKMDGAGGLDLLKQAIKLSTWREAAFVAEYSPTGFSAAPLDDVIYHRGGVQSFAHAKPLANYLGQDFLDCLVGDDDLRYLAKDRQLVWRAQNGEIVSTKFQVKHRFAIDVHAPGLPNSVNSVDRIVTTEEVHNFRMAANPEEILAVPDTQSVAELKEAKQRLALAYHPDQFSGLDSFYQSLMNSRMQEVNQAHDVLKSRRRVP